MDAPTVTDIRSESNLYWEELGYPLPQSGETDRLEIPLSESLSEFWSITGLDLAQINDDDATDDYDVRSPWIRKLIRMLVEFNVGSSTPETLETTYDFDLISNMSIGPYSETRRSLNANDSILHPSPPINRVIGMIMNTDPDGGSAGADGKTPQIGHTDFRPFPGEGIIYPERVGEAMGPRDPFGPWWR